MQNGDQIQISVDSLYGENTYEFITSGGEQSTKEFTNQTKDVSIESVTLEDSSLELEVGDTRLLPVALVPENATNQMLQWYSSNPSIADVKDGKVTCYEKGIVKIYCMPVSEPEKTQTCVLSVNEKKVLVENITLEQDEYYMKEGDTLTLTAEVLPKNAANREIKWESNNPTVATVDEMGKVKAMKQGTATITVSSSDGSEISASCMLIVKSPIDFSIIEVSEKTYGDEPFRLACEGRSGNGTVTYSVEEDNSVLEINEDMAFILGAGTVKITATKASDGKYKEEKAEYQLTVKPKTLEPLVSGTVTKQYDGNTSVTDATSNNLTITLQGVLDKDKEDVSALVASYEYADAEVGTNKSIQVSGITLQGKASSNYTLSMDKMTADVGTIESRTSANKADGTKTGGGTSGTSDGTKSGESAASTSGGTKVGGSASSTSGGTKAGGSASSTSGGSTSNTASGKTSSATSGNTGGTTNGNADSATGGSTITSNKTEITIVSNSSKLIYKITSNTSKERTVSLSRVEKISKKVAIPSTVKDPDTGFTYKVTGIAKNVFKNRTELTSVIISSNIKTIGSNAFNGCSKLSNITIYADNLKKVGKNAFKGIMKKAVVKTEAKDKDHYNKIKKLLKDSGIKNVKYKYRLKK